MVDTKFQDIIKLNPYTRQNLREELNDIIEEKRNACWKNSVTPQPYGGDFERSIIYLCSAFTTQNGDSKRNKLMPIIYRFEVLKTMRKYIFLQMKKIKMDLTYIGKYLNRL